MSSHKASIRWTSEGAEDFARGRYSRAHFWSFDGGATVPASASPHVVPNPWSDPAGVDPEEAFVAAISSCHMLTFLDLARRAGFHPLSYDDEAEGFLEKNAQSRSWVSRVLLRPRIVWADGRAPAPERLAELHDQAHALCFIANSVATDIRVEG